MQTAYAYNKGLNKLMTGLKYLVAGQGPGRQNFLESGRLPALASPIWIARTCRFTRCWPSCRITARSSSSADGFTFHVCQLRPESPRFRGAALVGSVSPIPPSSPTTCPTDEDRRAIREGVKIARDVVGQAAFDSYREEEFMPGGSVNTDAEIDAWVRQRAETIYHPVGTCRMGAAGDPLAVVDDQLRVQGIAGLRVIDASVMPTLVGGNTNATDDS